MGRWCLSLQQQRQGSELEISSAILSDFVWLIDRDFWEKEKKKASIFDLGLQTTGVLGISWWTSLVLPGQKHWVILICRGEMPFRVGRVSTQLPFSTTAYWFLVTTRCDDQISPASIEIIQINILDIQKFSSIATLCDGLLIVSRWVKTNLNSRSCDHWTVWPVNQRFSDLAPPLQKKNDSTRLLRHTDDQSRLRCLARLSLMI